MAGHEPGMAERESGRPPCLTPRARPRSAAQGSQGRTPPPTASEDLGDRGALGRAPSRRGDPVTPASVEHDVPPTRARSPMPRARPAPRSCGPDPSESAELLRPRGGAHRRQAAAVQLTGCRRRGRGARHD
ncbi:hypothetical protein QJS66_18925 [Kocuria rhizophila]|nr:hypothetical protein QJS66_18925 [Kocuria rhizophila]